jgi:hypothetical protein
MVRTNGSINIPGSFCTYKLRLVRQMVSQKRKIKFYTVLLYYLFIVNKYCEIKVLCFLHCRNAEPMLNKDAIFHTWKAAQNKCWDIHCAMQLLGLGLNLLRYGVL